MIDNSNGQQEAIGGVVPCDQSFYSNPIGHTSQFTMCGNCFRADMYRGCDFGCKYCFANNRNGNFKVKNQVANIKLIEKWFYEALDLGEQNNIKKELLNKKVPLHLGGMADPFQSREWEYGTTKEFIKLTKKYNYPVCISTKAAYLPDDYYAILDSNIHTFQISLIGVHDDYIRRFETNTPLAMERIKFIKELKSRGFWVSIRIQPLIDINEAIELITFTEKYVDYYTVEHLKLPSDNNLMMKTLMPLIENIGIKLLPRGREYEFDTKSKKENIDRIKRTTKVKIGCGDNDLHILSDSLNCCGVDVMPPAFKNWLKYNSMYIKMTGDRTQWRPQNNCNSCFNSTCIVRGYDTMEKYVDKYYIQTYGNDEQESLFPNT